MALLTQYHHHGRFPVAGGVLPDAITAYRTYGDISNPCIVFPTCFGAKLDSELPDSPLESVVNVLQGQLYMVGEGKASSSIQMRAMISRCARSWTQQSTSS